MLRITGADVAADLHGSGKDGFADPDPGVTAATVVTGDWLNGVQEEIANAIEGSGFTLSASDDQLLAVISGSTTITANLTASVNDYAPTDWSSAGIVRLTASAPWTITGFDASAGTQRKLLVNADSTDNITIADSSGSSASANRVISPTQRDYVLRPDCCVWIYYDATSTRWRIATDTNNAIDLALDTEAANGFLDQDFDWTGDHAFAGVCSGAAFTYTTPPDRVVQLNLLDGHAETSGAYTASHYGSVYTASDAVAWLVPVTVPSGCTIKKVRAGYTQTGSPGGGNEATLTLYRTEPNVSSGAVAAPTAIDSATGNVAAGTYVLDTGTITEESNRIIASYLVRLVSGGGAATATEFNWLEVTFTDAGPRNH